MHTRCYSMLLPNHSIGICLSDELDLSPPWTCHEYIAPGLALPEYAMSTQCLALPEYVMSTLYRSMFQTWPSLSMPWTLCTGPCSRLGPPRACHEHSAQVHVLGLALAEHAMNTLYRSMFQVWPSLSMPWIPQTCVNTLYRFVCQTWFSLSMPWILCA